MRPSGRFSFLLKIGDNHAELLVAQLVEFVLKAVVVQIADQLKIGIIGHAVHTVAHFQVVENL